MKACGTRETYFCDSSRLISLLSPSLPIFFHCVSRSYKRSTSEIVSGSYRTQSRRLRIVQQCIDPLGGFVQVLPVVLFVALARFAAVYLLNVC